MPRKTPKPRCTSYYGMPIQNIVNPDGTWLEAEEFTYPSGGYHRRAFALCPDGRKRVFRASIPDTFFTIPCRGKINKKYVTGFLTSDNDGSFKFNQTAKEGVTP